jgi:hypothetical protein
MAAADAKTSVGGAMRADLADFRAEDSDREPAAEEEADAAYEVEDDLAESKPKKKRKLVKNGDKKYQCPHADCGKAYSRAEHLYRHQLNRKFRQTSHVQDRLEVTGADTMHRADTPKQIYRCDFPGCNRHFVRADLCARHKERHTAKGSHLQRKDAFFHSQRPVPSASSTTSPSLASGGATMNASPISMTHGPHPPPTYPEPEAVTSAPMQHYPASEQYRGAIMSDAAAAQGIVGAPLDPQLPYAAYQTSANGAVHPLPPLGPPPSPNATRRLSFDNGFSRPPVQAPGYNPPQALTINSMHPPPISSPSAPGGLYTQQACPSPSASSQQFRSPSSYSMLPSLPPFGLPQGYPPHGGVRSNIISPPSITSVDQHPVPNSRCNSIADFNVIDQMATGYSMPVFGTEPFNRSPPVMIDDNFINSLFTMGALEMPPNPSPPPGPIPMHHHMEPLHTALPKLEPDGTPQEQTAPSDPWSPPTVNGVNSMDISIRESNLGEKKRLRLIQMVEYWPDIDQNPGRRTKGDILMGDSSDPQHVLSLHMLKTYMTSYWIYIHQQMPILHRPTFNPETCPELLLLAMMCLGATCLERNSPVELTKNSAELAFFIAYHIRWEIFKDAEFRPTAKLWTFQAMLLLELFEKMYSTRTLHERAHIHHATTLTVMRRGSSLIGRNATDSPQNGNDPTRTPPGPDGSINTSGQNTPDAFWNRWITAEATRRVAFAAFIIDSTHATLFGHSAVMSPHDLKLPLPCDEALWSATSSAEVQRVEASLAANGFKPTSFVEGLRRCLNGQKTRTNVFGRVILMAGLLNVSWHLNQRDLQVSSLGVQNTLGNQIKWRGPLTRAFDFWRRDFGESISKNGDWLQFCNPSSSSDRNSTDRKDNIFESRTCLHSLAHMAMHVDMIDCEVFAGSERVLGRVVTDSDRAAVNRRMREQWAPSARARDATFYALRFLYEVLIPGEELNSKRQHPHQPPTFTYSARDDYLLNRPWILFFATLIVWSYGYALDGPIRPSNYTLTTRELQVHDMQRYLTRMAGVASPDDLEKLKDRNSCLGLLLLMYDCFQQPRWELLHEASGILASCIDLLMPGHSSPAISGKN